MLSSSPVPAADEGTLFIVAGASCVGKTTFLRALEQGQVDRLPADLRSRAFGSYRFLTAMDLAEEGAGHGNLVLHYDLFRPITFHGELSFDADPVLSVIGRARDVAVLTLWEPPEILRARAARRRKDLRRKKLTRPPMLRGFPENWAAYRSAARRRDLMQPWFEDPEKLRELHERWYAFCAAREITNHWVLKPSGREAARNLEPNREPTFDANGTLLTRERTHPRQSPSGVGG